MAQFEILIRNFEYRTENRLDIFRQVYNWLEWNRSRVHQCISIILRADIKERNLKHLHLHRITIYNSYNVRSDVTSGERTIDGQTCAEWNIHRRASMIEPHYQLTLKSFRYWSVVLLRPHRWKKNQNRTILHNSHRRAHDKLSSDNWIE